MMFMSTLKYDVNLLSKHTLTYPPNNTSVYIITSFIDTNITIYTIWYYYVPSNSCNN